MYIYINHILCLVPKSQVHELPKDHCGGHIYIDITDIRHIYIYIYVCVCVCVRVYIVYIYIYKTYI